MFESKSTLWVVHISSNEVGARRAQAEEFICIGWTEIGDLSSFDTRDKMKTAYRTAYPLASDGNVRASYGQVFRFAHEMQIGDPVVYPIKGSRDILIGEIIGNYEWRGNDKELLANDYSNVRRVKWLKRVPRIAFSQPALHSFGSFTSVASSDEFLEEVVAILKGEKTIEPSGQKETTHPAPNGAKPKPDEDEGEAERESLVDRAVEETKDYLLRQWSRSGTDFEEVVAAVFRAMGYTATCQAGAHDLGVDVVAHPDPLGVQPPLLKIQAKSGTGTIGAPAVKQLRGLLNDREKGVLVALGGFSNDARHVQQNDADLVLIDGSRFVELFLEFYERLSPEVRHRLPLKRVYVFAGP